MKCAVTLKIITKNEDSESVFQTDAELTRSALCDLVRYEIEGDRGELLFNGDSLRMTRKGGCSLSATFCAGSDGAFVLQSNGQAGELPLHTALYSYEREEQGLLAQLHYHLLGSEQVQKFQLTILVSIPEEK